METLTLLTDVVSPVLHNLLRAGELQEVRLYEANEEDSSFIVLEARIKDEIFKTFLHDNRVDEPPVAELRSRFASDLTDFIAESGFGWGEQRPPRGPVA